MQRKTALFSILGVLIIFLLVTNERTVGGLGAAEPISQVGSDTSGSAGGMLIGGDLQDPRAGAPPVDSYVPDHVIVKLKLKTSDLQTRDRTLSAVVKELSNQCQLLRTRRLFPVVATPPLLNYELFQFAPSCDAPRIVRRANELAEVDFAELDHLMELTRVPNDVRFPEQCDDGRTCDLGQPCNADSDCPGWNPDIPAGMLCKQRNGDACKNDCTPNVCGDGALFYYSQTERCDDGNRVAGDGCSPTCTLEPCGVPSYSGNLCARCPPPQTEDGNYFSWYCDQPNSPVCGGTCR